MLLSYLVVLLGCSLQLLPDICPELYDYFLSKDSHMHCLFYFPVEEQLLLRLFDSEFQYEYRKLLLEKDGIYLEIQMELFFAEIG